MNTIYSLPQLSSSQEHLHQDFIFWHPWSHVQQRLWEQKSQFSLFFQFIKQYSSSHSPPFFHFCGPFNQFPGHMSLQQWFENHQIEWSRFPPFLDLDEEQSLHFNAQDISLGLLALQLLQEYLSPYLHRPIRQSPIQVKMIAQLFPLFFRAQEWNYLEFVEESFQDTPSLWSNILHLLYLTCKIEQRNYFILTRPGYHHYWSSLLQRQLMCALFWESQKSPQLADHYSTQAPYTFLDIKTFFELLQSTSSLSRSSHQKSLSSSQASARTILFHGID
jgi:hypothetical protein